MEALKIAQFAIHYSMHLLVPGLIAFLFFREIWKKAWLIFLATMIVDLDHLAANPIFDPERCSIGFHFLHSWPAIAVYAVFFFISKNQILRIISLGLLFHMFTDGLDCLMSRSFY